MMKGRTMGRTYETSCKKPSVTKMKKEGLLTRLKKDLTRKTWSAQRKMMVIKRYWKLM